MTTPIKLDGVHTVVLVSLLDTITFREVASGWWQYFSMYGHIVEVTKKEAERIICSYTQCFNWQVRDLQLY